MKKIIYIAGSYTLGNREKNILIAEKAAKKIWNMGGVAICPHLNSKNFEKTSKVNYEDFLDGYFRIISVCDAIYMLPNWTTSKGSIREHDFAKKNNITTLFSILDVEKFILKKHKGCSLTSNIKTKYETISGYRVSSLLVPTIEDIVKKEYYKKMAGFIRLPNL